MNFNRTFKQWLWLYWWMHTELFYQWPKSSNFLLDAFQITICSMHPKEIFLNMANFEANWIIFIDLTNQSFSFLFFHVSTYLSTYQTCIKFHKFWMTKKNYNPLSVQVNLCQKLLFLHQLTHNMTTDCSLKYKFNTWKIQAQTLGEHVVYRNCFWH